MSAGAEQRWRELFADLERWHQRELADENDPPELADLDRLASYLVEQGWRRER